MIAGIHRTADRRGFALIFVITLLAMLLTFLIAAQGAVLTHVMEGKRRAERAAAENACGEALSRALSGLRAAPLDSRELNVERDGVKAALKLEPMPVSDPVYAGGKRVRPRAGDALATISISADGPIAPAASIKNAQLARVRRYLVNPARSTPAIEIIPIGEGR